MLLVLCATLHNERHTNNEINNQNNGVAIKDMQRHSYFMYRNTMSLLFC